MAAAAAIGASNAHGVTLSLYYGQETTYANSNNGEFISTGYNLKASAIDAQGETENLTGTVTPLSISNSGTTTIVLPVGAYFSLAIDAVLTGNANPYAGVTTGQRGFTEPSYLGLTELGIAISSSDSTGVALTPISSVSSGAVPDTTIDGIPSYTSTANINTLLPANGGSAIAPAPIWSGATEAGEVQPNLRGYDTSPNSNGGFGFDHTLGLGIFPFGGNARPVTGNSPAGITEITQFTTQNNVASYTNATDFVDNMTFQFVSGGFVTLAPFVVTAGTNYWTALPAQINGSSASAVRYTSAKLSSSDVIFQLPKLVIERSQFEQPIGVVAVSPGPNLSYHGYGTVITNGTGTDQGTFSPAGNSLAIAGSNGNYSLAQVTGIDGGAGASKDIVEASTFDPSSDEEIFAVDILVNGTQATAAQLQTLINTINLGDVYQPASAGVTATSYAHPGSIPAKLQPLS
jgi:hypothetical protein